MKKSIELIKQGIESSTTQTQEFKRFAKTFKKELKEDFRGIFEITKFNVGHFILSGFMKDNQGKYYYFSLPDVRFATPKYKIMIRTAKNEKDYIGGTNQFIELDDIHNGAFRLTQR